MTPSTQHALRWINLLVVLALILPQPIFASTPFPVSFTPPSGRSIPLGGERTAGISSESSSAPLSAARFYLPTLPPVSERNANGTPAAINSRSTSHSDLSSTQSALPAGAVIYQGLLVDAGPIPSVPGHYHVLHVQYSQADCGNCGVTVFVGDQPNVWPDHILGWCFTGYGPSAECTSQPFLSPGNALYVDAWLTPFLERALSESPKGSVLA